MSNFNHYVIYNPTTFQRTSNVYATERAAKAQRTKLIKAGKAPVDAVVDTFINWFEKEPMVPTVNLMSGETIMIRQSNKGTILDPGTEAYWVV